MNTKIFIKRCVAILLSICLAVPMVSNMVKATDTADTFDYLERTKNGSGRIQQIGDGTTTDFGGKTGNFIFHSKVKVDDLINADGSINYPEAKKGYTFKYIGWGSTGGQCNYGLEIYFETTSVHIIFKSAANGWVNQTYTLTNDQIKKLGTDGLSFYLVHDESEKKVFDVYVEDGTKTGVMDTTLQITSTSNTNEQVYQIGQGAIYQVDPMPGVTAVTTGYSYTDVYTTRKDAVDAFSELVGMDIQVTLTGEHVKADSLPQTCHMGDYVTFSPKSKEGYAITKLTIDGTECTLDANGEYKLAVSKEHLDGISVEIETLELAPTFDYLLDTKTNQGTRVQQIGTGKTVDFGAKTGNFVFHTKMKVEGLVNNEEIINYPTEQKQYQVSYVGWGNKTCDYGLVIYFDVDSVHMLFKSAADGWKEDQTYTLTENQIRKLGTEGLSLYLVHSAAEKKVFDVYVEDGETSGVMDTTLQITSGTNPNEQVYQIGHSGTMTGVTAVTTGYSYTDVHATRKDAVDVFSELVGIDIPVTLTGEHVEVGSLPQTCHMGDYVTFAPKSKEGYAITKMTIDGTECALDANGEYKLAVSKEHLDGINVEIETLELAPTFDYLERTKNGSGRIQQIGDGTTTDFGGKTGNFIFHSKVKVDDLINADGSINYPEEKKGYTFKYIGWGSTGGQCNYGLEIYFETTSVHIIFKSAANGWIDQTYTLTNDQIKKLGTDGLSFYLVHDESEKKVFDVYVEDGTKTGVMDTTLQITSTSNTNEQVYQIGQGAISKVDLMPGVTAVTTGYSYTDVYTTRKDAVDAFSELVGMDIPVTLIGEHVKAASLPQTCHMGDYVTFAPKSKEGYAITKMTIDGTECTLDANGEYKLAVSKEHLDGINVEIETLELAPTYDYLLDTKTNQGTRVQQIGTGKTVDFGAKTGNFVFHTKLKVEGLVNNEGIINYPTEQKQYQVSYVGWGNKTCDYGLVTYFDVDSVHMLFKSAADGWKEDQTYTLTENQIRKLGTEGLSLYLVHSAAEKKVFDVYVEDGETSGVMDTTLQITSGTNPNEQVYQIGHSGTMTGVTAVTTGYSYTDAHATRKDAVDRFAMLVALDIPVTFTGEHVNAEAKTQTYHMGDYITLDPKLDSGYTMTGLTWNDAVIEADEDGVRRLFISLEHLGGVSAIVSAESAEFTEFVTLTGVSKNKHGDQKGRFVFHTLIQSDNLAVDAENPYVQVVYNIYGSNVIENLFVRLYLTDANAGKIQLGRWCEEYQNTLYAEGALDAAQLMKLKGDGLNLYMVHSYNDLNHYEVYVENGISSDVVKLCEYDVCHGEHVFQTQHTVVGEGASVTTTGYQYSENMNIGTAPSVLFWSDLAAQTGNVNDDNDVDVRDVVRVMRYVDNEASVSVNTRAGDGNGDHSITLQDISNVCEKVLLGDVAVELNYYDNMANMTDKSYTALNRKLFYDNSMNPETFVGGADPAVMEITKDGDSNKGKYIMMVTGVATNQSIPVYMSSDLANWSKKGEITLTDESGQVATMVANKDLWAMEMIYDSDEDKYYLFLSATPEAQVTDSKIKEVPYVAVGSNYTGDFQLIPHDDYRYADGVALFEKEGSETLGYAAYLKYMAFDPYSMAQKLQEFKKQGLVDYAAEHAFQAIDLHPFVDGNNKYLYFSLTGGTHQVIMGMQMKSWGEPDYTTLKVLTQNKKSKVNNGVTWDVERGETNEGPWMTKHDGKYYLTFSINGYGYDNYKVLQAVSTNPLGDFEKIAVDEGGILIGSDRIGEISGPGHHSLIEKDGEMYILYHAHQDPSAKTPRSSRYVALDKVEWVTNNGLEVMYVNGPTKTSIQPLPGFATGYNNIAPTATITANGNEVTGLNDKVWNSKGSTWRGKNSGIDTFFGDTVAKDVEFNGETTITMNFAEAKTVRALMIYNSSDTTKAFDKIERIEFVCADGSVKYINHLGFDFTANTYTKAKHEGVTTGDDKFICGASVAEFNELQVTEIRITVKPGTEKSYVALGEIVVLGKN